MILYKYKSIYIYLNVYYAPKMLSKADHWTLKEELQPTKHGLSMSKACWDMSKSK